MTRSLKVTATKTWESEPEKPDSSCQAHSSRVQSYQQPGFIPRTLSVLPIRPKNAQTKQEILLSLSALVRLCSIWPHRCSNPLRCQAESSWWTRKARLTVSSAPAFISANMIIYELSGETLRKKESRCQCPREKNQGTRKKKKGARRRNKFQISQICDTNSFS